VVDTGSVLNETGDKTAWGNWRGGVVEETVVIVNAGVGKAYDLAGAEDALLPDAVTVGV